MNELTKAVLALALSTAATVWLLGAALHLWPNADQLAYGNPLPYLKVKFDRSANAVRFWVEDFNGLQYERVWLYVNGRLAASGGPSTDATAKCGDEVAAVVKYHSGVKKLEGRILCTQPIKAPGGEVKLAIRLMQVAQAYRAMTGDMDQTGVPVRFSGWCAHGGWYNSDGFAEVEITATRPDVILCIGTRCGTHFKFKWEWFRRDIHWNVTIHVFKVPDAPASQLLGGGRAVAHIYIDYGNIMYVYVNGTEIASCWARSETIKEVTSWTERMEPNATGSYLIRFRGETQDGRQVVLDAHLDVYEREDGSFGYRLIVHPVEDPTQEDLTIQSPHAELVLESSSGTVYYGAVYAPFALNEMFAWLWSRLFGYDAPDNTGMFFKFLEWLHNNPQHKQMLIQALDRAADFEFNVPYTFVERTSEYSVYHAYAEGRRGSTSWDFKTLSLSSFGAVYANTILPIDIKLPPPVMPPRLPSPDPPQNATGTNYANATRPIDIRLLPRMHIFVYR